MKRSQLFTLLSSLGIAAGMILTAALVAWIGRTALGSFEVWQQAFESVRPYLRWWRALLYGAVFALWWDLLRRYRHRPSTARKAHRGIRACALDRPRAHPIMRSPSCS